VNEYQRLSTFASSFADEKANYAQNLSKSQSTMASMGRPTSSFAADAINNLSISSKMHLLSSTQEGPVGPNAKPQTHSDSASTRRTTQHTKRSNGGVNPSRSFHHLMAQSTFDHSEGSGPVTNKITRKVNAVKTPITSYKDENKINVKCKNNSKK